MSKRGRERKTGQDHVSLREWERDEGERGATAMESGRRESREARIERSRVPLIERRVTEPACLSDYCESASVRERATVARE